MAKAAALLLGAAIVLAAALAPAVAQVVVHEHEWAPGAREFSLAHEEAFLEKHFPELANGGPESWADPAVEAYANFLFVLTIAVAALIFLSGLDDALVDAYYWLSSARRRKRLLAHLEEKAQSEFAIMVPAWKEHDVIAAMIDNTVKTLDYEAYRIYCGVYRNDAATAAEVNRMVARYPERVVRVDVPHDGPTCKADCLNHIVRRILSEEARGGRSVAASVLHDSEDVIHPLELKLFNTLVPGADLVQLPVLSLERAYRDFTAGTYIDDFAEAHGKDMAVREALVGLVPGAGVSTCYSRQAMAALWKASAGEPFNTASLTEDYDLSFRLRSLGMTQSFAHVSVGSSPARPAHVPARTASLVATHEYFPDKFKAAYRQRARWILGIAFQGWRNIGWRGGMLERYFLFRDRKVLVMPLVGTAAYLLLANFALVFAFGDDVLRHVLESMLAGVEPLLYLNLASMCNRALQRMYFVGRYYGPAHAALSVVRAPLNNFINFFAAMRAWRLFVAHALTGKKLAWDKTAHVYPDTLAFAAKALGVFALCSTLFLATPENSIAAPPPLSGRASTLVGEAHKAMERGELERAMRLASEALKLAPGHASVLLLQAYILARQDRPLEALERIRTLPAADLGPWGLSHRGYLWLKVKNAAAAEADFTEAMKLEGLTAEARAGMAGDLAYLILESKDDARALQWFRIALETPRTGSANAGLYADAGYTAMRLGQNRLAIEWFSKALDASYEAPADKKPFDEVALYDMRRAVATLSRRWGTTLYIGHSSTQAAAASGLAAAGRDLRVVQAGAEIFYTPETFGYRNGRVFQLYANIFQGLSANEEGYPTGSDSRVAGIGARYKPFPDHNLSFAVERHLALGAQAGNDDWLLRAAWSAGEGTDWQPTADAWLTWQAYTEAVYFTKAERLIQPFEARIGRSTKLAQLHGAVFTPYLVIAGEYDRAQSPSTAAGIGPGVALRYWFGESRYSAFRSHADLSFQYRLRVTEARRGGGLFGQLTVSF
jgi:bacteriophage N4 adsorption protein B